ncbi:MAG: hypothetical protein IPK76_05965 [Lewinellaceae bacterium]|nr:hypothetical protein [Lewinellaceae bacterium]
MPLASRTTLPPTGSDVSRDTPASSIARAFAIKPCPLAWYNTTGLLGEAALSASWYGYPFTVEPGEAFHFSWCQPLPEIHSPAGVEAAFSATMPVISCQVLAWSRFRFCRLLPSPEK